MTVEDGYRQGSTSTTTYNQCYLSIQHFNDIVITISFQFFFVNNIFQKYVKWPFPKKSLGKMVLKIVTLNKIVEFCENGDNIYVVLSIL